MEINEQKAALRKTMLERRLALPETTRMEATARVCEQLLSLTIPMQSVLAGYRAMRGELDILQAMLGMHDRKYTLCLPTLAPPERMMEFRQWKPKMPLKKGAYGTLEPDGSPLCVPHTLWVPLLAFDASGHRLGYGGGYYDATLTALRRTHPNLLAIGVAFACQEVPSLPAQAHDMRLDMIVTEEAVFPPHRAGLS